MNCAFDIYTGPYARLGFKTYQDYHVWAFGSLGAPSEPTKRYPGGVAWRFGVGFNFINAIISFSYNLPIGNFYHIRNSDEMFDKHYVGIKDLGSLSLGLTVRF